VLSSFDSIEFSSSGYALFDVLRDFLAWNSDGSSAILIKTDRREFKSYTGNLAKTACRSLSSSKTSSFVNTSVQQLEAVETKESLENY
jgi:hypothetical protein